MNIPFHITPATSVFTHDGTKAFEGDNSGPDTLIVDSGAYLISAEGGAGAVLANTGAWTVTVNGSVVSQFAVGIFLDEGNAAVSTIKIGVDGEVQGSTIGLFLGSSANVNNAGTIASFRTGILISAGGAHTITNSGTISGSNFGVADVSGGNVTVNNSGTISGGIDGGIDLDSGKLGDGNNKLTNSGTIGGDVGGGSGTDKMTDFAIVGGVMQSGTIAGTIDLRAGNDKFTGGANAETVRDGNGADIVSLGGGNDTYIATGNTGTDGIDVIKGGAGIDTYDASAAPAFIFVNLDTVAHGTGANTATGTDVSGAATDSIRGFENANGGSGDDAIFGSAAGNRLNGGDGGDLLDGLGGNDTLDGGAGPDSLIGGPGKDQLTGGPDGDTFFYTALSDSGITAGTRDLIADFEQGTDKINLARIDANTTNAAGTDDAFTFIGTNTPFTGSPGQLHAFWSAIGQIVEGDVNGDKKADFSIEIADPTHAITLSNTSFFL